MAFSSQRLLVMGGSGATGAAFIAMMLREKSASMVIAPVRDHAGELQRGAHIAERRRVILTVARGRRHPGQVKLIQGIGDAPQERLHVVVGDLTSKLGALPLVAFLSTRAGLLA